MSDKFSRQSNTKLLIVQEAARMFLAEGYKNSSINKLAKNLDMSLGNITFYFKTKEHLLALIVDDMISYQMNLMENAADDADGSLIAYCLELPVMAAACDESEMTREFYMSAYTSNLTLPIIRKSDTEKTKRVFGQFHPDWTDEQWVATENIVSGIEYATIMTRAEETPLPLLIEKSVDAILHIYGVPAAVRCEIVEKILTMDYRSLAKEVMSEFPKQVMAYNAQNLENSLRGAKKSKGKTAKTRKGRKKKSPAKKTAK